MARILQLYCVRPNSGRVEPGETVEVQGVFSSTINVFAEHRVQRLCLRV